MKQKYSFNYRSNGKPNNTNSFKYIVLPVLNIKYSIAAKYFPEMNSINVSKQTHKFTKVVIVSFCHEFLEERGMNYM